MQILLNAPALSGFSLDSLRFYILSKVDKMQRVLPDFEGEHRLKVSIKRTKNQFEILLEIMIPQPIVVTTTGFDLHKAIDDALQTTKRVLRKEKEKKENRRTP